MSNRELNLQLTANKSKTFKNSRAGRVSYVETLEGEHSPENETTPELKRNTPILFSTNRGLHLRMTSTNLTHTKSSYTDLSINSTYNMAFCDLERWSTNRANTISLEDTFTVPKHPVVNSSSAANGSLVSNSLRILPQKSTSLRFSGYTRFDVE